MTTYKLNEPIEITVSGTNIYDFYKYNGSSYIKIYSGKVYPFPNTTISVITLNDLCRSNMGDWNADLDTFSNEWSSITRPVSSGPQVVSKSSTFKLVTTLVNSPFTSVTTIFDVLNINKTYDELKTQMPNLIQNGLMNVDPNQNWLGTNAAISLFPDGGANRCKVVQSNVSGGIYYKNDYLRLKVGTRYTLSFYSHITGGTLNYGVEDTVQGINTSLNIWSYNTVSFVATRVDGTIYFNTNQIQDWMIDNVMLVEGSDRQYDTLNVNDAFDPSYIPFNVQEKNVSMDDIVYTDIYLHSAVPGDAVYAFMSDNAGHSYTYVLAAGTSAGYNRLKFNVNKLFLHNGITYTKCVIINGLTGVVHMTLHLVSGCPKYTIFYMNGLNAVDSISCNQASKFNEDNEVNYIKVNPRQFNGSVMTGQINDHSKKAANIESNGSYEMKTNILTDIEHQQLKELAMSPKIWVYEFDTNLYYSVILSDSKFVDMNYSTDRMKNRVINLKRSQTIKRY